MKKIIALVLSLMMLLTCVAALAETAENPEKEDMGVLKMNKAFDIKYNKPGDGYEVNIQTQNDMTIIANIFSSDAKLPRMGLIIAFNDEWAETERLNDVSDEDLEGIKASFLEEYDEIEFEIKETAYGTKLLIAKVAGGQDAYVYTIYKGHEIEIHLVPGAEAEALEETDIDRVVTFLSDMDFVPVEE